MKKPAPEQLAQMIGDLVTAANLLHAAVGEAALVMSECPHCNRGDGKAAAVKVWQALDAYEPAIATLYARLKLQPGPRRQDSGVN